MAGGRAYFLEWQLNEDVQDPGNRGWLMGAARAAEQPPATGHTRVRQFQFSSAVRLAAINRQTRDIALAHAGSSTI